MNQIMPVGKGILIVISDEHVPIETYRALEAAWQERFPDVPGFVMGPAEIVVRDDKTLLFEFTGTNLTPTFVAEFQKWWEGVSYG